MCSRLKHGARGPKRFGMSAQGAREAEKCFEKVHRGQGAEMCSGKVHRGQGAESACRGWNNVGLCGRNLVPFFSFGDHAGFITEYIVPFSF